MKFWEKWRRRKQNKDTKSGEVQDQEQECLISRDSINMSDAGDRERYVHSLLEQIADASVQIGLYKEEYQTVDRYLKDIEEIEYFSPQEKQQVTEYAKAIRLLEGDKSKYEEKKQHLSDEEFSRLEKLEDEVEEGVGKLREAESYQQAIRSDMVHLENEKQACLFRREEARTAMENLRGMAIICTAAVFACMLLLLFMQFALEMDAQIGYLLTAGVAAIALTAMYMKYLDASGERKRAMGSLNKVILLQNRVKIRYINNTNLLDYLYLKYGVSSAEQLASLFEKYQAEKEERNRIRETMKELTFSQEELLKILKKHKLYDPLIWLRQTEALLDPKEMVEVRHALIARRQKLRKQMEFNTQNAEDAQQQIRDIVADYPQYAKEILKMVSDYEERYA